MRKSYPSYSLLTLSGLIFAASCSIIAEVDRTKIPQEGDTPSDGGQGTGGTGARGGSAGGGRGGMDTGGTGGDAGGGGEPSGGAAGVPTTGGTAGDAGGGMGGAGEGGVAGDAGGGVGGDPGPVCGDSVVEAPETCDDGDMPPAGSDGCSATCATEAGWTCNNAMPTVCTAICGDRLVVGSEACDDGNNDNCGTCRQGCMMTVTPTAATGSITPIVDTTHPVDADTFVLDDGSNPPVTFEFDNNATATGVAVAFTGTSTAADVRDAIIAAVQAQRTGGSLDIGAAAAGTAPSVTLTNLRATSLGNGPITGTNNGSYTKVDMAGGLAGDCGATVGCTPASTSSNVCASGDCNSTNQCTVP